MQTQNFIDGEFRPARSGATDVVLAPATGQELAVVASSDAADVHDAVESAKAAFVAFKDKSVALEWGWISDVACHVSTPSVGIVSIVAY